MDDNPFEKLSQFISSTHSHDKDEGPAFEYPEVIQGKGKYTDNVQRHITGLKDTHHGSSRAPKGRYSSAKTYNKNKLSSSRSKYDGVYSFGKSMSTIPYSYVKSDSYEPNEPSVLEQLARSHITGGEPIRLSSSGSVSSHQHTNSYAEPKSDHISSHQHTNSYAEPKAEHISSHQHTSSYAEPKEQHLHQVDPMIKFYIKF